MNAHNGKMWVLNFGAMPQLFRNSICPPEAGSIRDNYCDFV